MSTELMNDNTDIKSTLNSVRNELIEDTDENLQAVMNILQDHLSHKIGRDQFLQAINQYLKPDSFLEKIRDPNQALPQAKRNTRSKSQQWTTEEDERLRQGVQEHGPNDWGTVATLVGNGRTRAQCSQRWNRVLNPAINKANWTPEEEEKLLKAVQIIGTKSWTRVAQQLGDRTDVQCRFKYFHIAKKLAEQGQSDVYLQQSLEMAQNDFMPKETLGQ